VVRRRSIEPTARPRLEARSAAWLERTAQQGSIFVDGAQESVRFDGAQREAPSVGHLHESPRLRLSADARRDLSDGRRHELGRSCSTQPGDIIGEDLHVVAPSKAAGPAGRAVVVRAQGPIHNRNARSRARALGRLEGARGARPHPPGAERSGCDGRTVRALVGWATSLCSPTVEPCQETRLAE